MQFMYFFPLRFPRQLQSVTVLYFCCLWAISNCSTRAFVDKLKSPCPAKTTKPTQLDFLKTFN